MRYEYPSGVTEAEKPWVEAFENEVLPFITKNGPSIGEKALQGDKLCEEIVRRAHLFVNGLPQYRKFNLKILIHDLKLWEKSNDS